MSDVELLERFIQARSEDAFRAIVDRHAGLVYATCRRLLGPAHPQLDDAVQAVFVVLARRPQAVREPQHLGAWLRGTARLVAQNAIRTEARRRKHQERNARMSQDLSDSVPGSQPWDGARELLDASLDELSPKLREALELHFLQGLPRAEAAGRAGCSLDAFHKRIADGLEALRGCLSRRGVALPAAALAAGLAGEAAAAPAGVLAASQAAGWAAASGQAVASKLSVSLADAALHAMAWKQAALPLAAASMALMLTAAVVGVSAFAQPRPAPIPVPVLAEEVGPPAPLPEIVPAEPALEPTPVRVLGAAPFVAPESISDLDVSPDGKSVVAVYHGGFQVWDLESAKPVWTESLKEYGMQVRFLPDGRHLLTHQGTGYRDKVPQVWDLNTRKIARAFDFDTTPKPQPRPFLDRLLQTGSHGPDSRPLLGDRWLHIAPDGKTVFMATGLNFPPKGQPEGPVDVLAFDWTTGKQIKRLPNVARPGGANRYSVDMAFLSPDGSRLICADGWSGYSGEESKQAEKMDRARTSEWTLWSWPQGERLAAWRLPAGQRMYWGGQSGWLDDRLIYIHASNLDGSTYQTLLLEAATGKLEHALPGHGMLTPDRQRMWLLSERALTEYRLSDRQTLRTIPVPGIKHFGNLRLSADGNVLAASMNNQSLFLADLKNGKVLSPRASGHQAAPYWIAYGADGRLHVFDGRISRAYDDATGNPLNEYALGLYYTGGGKGLGPDGRLAIGAGKGDGRPEVWDTVAGKLLGHLPKVTSGGVKDLKLSACGRWVAYSGEYDGTLNFHDLRNDAELGSVQGPKHSFFGYCMQLGGVEWSDDGSRAYVADWCAAMFQADDRQTKALSGTLGLTGCFDTRKGALLWRFKDAAGKEIETGRALALHTAKDLVFLGYDGNQLDAWKAGLWKASDGSYVRELQTPGWGARFNVEGTLLVGTDAIVDVGTGKDVHRFALKQTRVVSPDGTLIGAADGSNTLRFYDARTGIECWRVTLPADALAAPPSGMLFHPSGAQVAVLLNKQPAVLQVDLFPRLAAPAALEPNALHNALSALESQDPAARQEAVKLLVAHGDAALDTLASACAAKSSQAARLAVLGLEWLARGGNAAARKHLEARAPAAGPLGGFCRDALLRLEAAQRAKALRAAHAQAQPLVWPPAAAKTPDDF
ncbi:MAG: sigma-70 family RNA polymerase sigma factor [Planctomycetes bacterium]|nr:sigma-70 family RNA polymerase sigma factor [Planctomycetota bacterium]